MSVSSSSAVEFVRASMNEVARMHQQLADSTVERTAAAAQAIEAALRRGNKLLVCGNGGSAAEAQHFAAELSGRFQRERPAWAAISLTMDTSALTAIGNDYGFDKVFARQVEGLGTAGDVLVGISTSGHSPNVLEAFRSGAGRGMTLVAMTGRDGGALGALADIHVNVAHPVTARVQEVQLSLLHAICELVEEGLTREVGK